LTEEVKEEIEEYLIEHPCSTATEIIDALDYNISVRTMRRILSELGYKYSSTLKEPLIIPRHVNKRLRFAHQNRRKFWNNAVFVDECTFMTFPFPKKAYQKKGERIVYQRPKKLGKLHVWGGISMEGKTALHIFTENLTGLLYKKILMNKLMPSMRRLYRGRRWILVQDNDPKHKSGDVEKYIRKANIEV